MNVILETERLVLRELGMADLGFITTLLGDRMVMRYWPRPLTREEALEWLRQQQTRYSRDGYGYWLVVERASGRPIGQAGLLRQEVESRLMVSLGCILHPVFWLHGFATEAAAACLDYAFARLELPEVIALVRPENLPSQGLVRKLGMARKRLIRYEALPHLLYVAERPAVSTPAEPTPNENENHLTGPDALDG